MVWTSRLTVIKRLENTEIETKQRTMPINGIKWGIDRDDKTAQKLPSQSKFGRNHNNSNGSSSSSGQWTFVISIWGLCAKELPTDHSCLSLELHRYTICVSKNRLGFFMLLFHSETNQTKRNWSLWMGSKWFFLNNLIPFYRNSAIIVRSEKNRVFGEFFLHRKSEFFLLVFHLLAIGLKWSVAYLVFCYA